MKTILKNKKNLFINLFIIFLFLITFSFTNPVEADFCETSSCDQTGAACVFNGYNCNGTCVPTVPNTCGELGLACTEYIHEVCEPFEPNPPENGSCGGSHYDCNAGTSGSNNDGATEWTWMCNGLYGGTNASCSEAKNLTQCSDGIDNDGDGGIDMGDYFCTDPGDDDERGPAGGWSACSCGGTRTCTNPSPESGGADCAGSTSCTPPGGCSVPVDGGWSAWSACSVTACGSTGTQTRTCSNPYPSNGGADCVGPSSQACSTPACVGMSGTLTPPSATCNIPNGQSSCTSNYTWTTTNPIGTSGILSNTNNSGASSPNFVVTTANNGGPTAFTLPYLNGGAHVARNFYLYNASIQLASATGMAECTPGTTWNGTICSGMSGTLTPPSATCDIPLGGTSCTINYTWATTNPVGTSGIISDTNNSGASSPNFVVTTANNGGPTAFTVPYNNNGSHVARNFYLYNASIQLASATGLANCVAGTHWGGSSCILNSELPMPISVDLKIKSATTTTPGDYSTPSTALYVRRGEVLTLPWTSTGNSSITCSSSDGVPGDGWASGTRSPNNVAGVSIAAPNTNGTQEYTITCTADSDLGMNTFQKVLAFLNPFDEVHAATIVTVTDTVWVNVSILTPGCTDPEGCSCTGPSCVDCSGCPIELSWDCPVPPSTSSVGINFETSDINPADGFGDVSGTVTLSPSVSTIYSVICNNDGGTGGPIDVKVIKKPIIIEN